jgi:DNA-binding PadR family transcriptional regulator
VTESLAHPPCPLVLSLLASQPRQAHQVAQALARAQLQTSTDGYTCAVTALERLRATGLVRARAGRTATIYQITARGRDELWLQRRLWAGLLRMRRSAA